MKIKHQELKPEACTSGSYLIDLDFSMMKDVPQPPYGSINSLTVIIHFTFILLGCYTNPPHFNFLIVTGIQRKSSHTAQGTRSRPRTSALEFNFIIF